MNDLQRAKNAGRMHWVGVRYDDFIDPTKLRRDWDIDQNQQHELAEQILKLIVLPNHIPELRREVTSDFEAKTGAVAISFAGGLHEARQRLGRYDMRSLIAADGTRRWVSYALAHSLGLVILTHVNPEREAAIARVYAMSESEYQTVSDALQQTRRCHYWNNLLPMKAKNPEGEFRNQCPCWPGTCCRSGV